MQFAVIRRSADPLKNFKNRIFVYQILTSRRFHQLPNLWRCMDNRAMSRENLLSCFRTTKACESPCATTQIRISLTVSVYVQYSHQSLISMENKMSAK